MKLAKLFSGRFLATGLLVGANILSSFSAKAEEKPIKDESKRPRHVIVPTNATPEHLLFSKWSDVEKAEPEYAKRSVPEMFRERLTVGSLDLVNPNTSVSSTTLENRESLNDGANGAVKRAFRGTFRDTLWEGTEASIIRDRSNDAIGRFFKVALAGSIVPDEPRDFQPRTSLYNPGTPKVYTGQKFGYDFLSTSPSLGFSFHLWNVQWRTKFRTDLEEALFRSQQNGTFYSAVDFHLFEGWNGRVGVQKELVGQRSTYSPGRGFISFNRPFDRRREDGGNIGLTVAQPEGSSTFFSVGLNLPIEKRRKY